MSPIYLASYLNSSKLKGVTVNPIANTSSWILLIDSYPA
jgi:hypothetical protein